MIFTIHQVSSDSTCHTSKSSGVLKVEDDFVMHLCASALFDAFGLICRIKYL